MGSSGEASLPLLSHSPIGVVSATPPTPCFLYCVVSGYKCIGTITRSLIVIRAEMPNRPFYCMYLHSCLTSHIYMPNRHLFYFVSAGWAVLVVQVRRFKPAPLQLLACSHGNDTVLRYCCKRLDDQVAWLKFVETCKMHSHLFFGSQLVCGYVSVLW